MDHQPQQRDPVQVLYVSRKWPPAIGGMETYSVELCAELPQFVKLTKRVLPGRANGYPPHPISLLRFLLATATFLLLHGGRYDVVHFGDLVLFPLAWLHAMRHRNVRRVVTVHGLDLLYGNRRGAGPAVYRRFLAWARRRSTASVHCYIANSRNTARLATEAGFAPVAPISLGVRLRSPAPMPAAPRQPAYLLFVGRIVPRKGAAWFASEVLPQLPRPMTLRVAGNPWDPRETDKLKASPRVEVLGFLDAPSLDRERAECLAIVMPNRSSTDQTDVEGFGIAALEAARDGVPIIASAIEGLTDAIIDGKSGFLVAEKDVDAWLHAIHRIQAWTPAQRADYARTAVATVAAHYTWTQVARATVRVYNAGTAPSADER